MESLFLPTFPNIAGLKSVLLLNIFFAVGAFLLLAFLLRYFIVKYRGRKKLYKQLEHLQSQATHLGKQMLAQKMKDAKDQTLCVLFVEYLERFGVNKPYSSVQQLLAQHGFDQEEVDGMTKVLYKGGYLEEEIEKKVRNC